jgi:WD domain, G-beta repeat
VLSREVTPGFSGAPIVDRLRNRVVGMVTSIIPPDEYGRQTETAFITPIETLRDVCSVLKLSDVCPYRNLEAFTEADATFFHGRERVIEMLVDNLQNEPRFLAVFGASGSGKSSVVQAGLIPRLRNGALPGSDRWDIIVTRPTDAFFTQHLAYLDQASTSVALVIDQFEELFVSDNETASLEVMTQLAHLLEHSPHVTLLIVMRDDFYSLLMRQETLAVWLKGRVVNVWPTLKREEVEAIIREPAELMGWQFEEGLVETIVDDVLATSAKGRKKDESSTILPLLEFTLTQLWERHQDGLLTHEDYRRIGGVTGGLRQWADNAYYTFADRQRPLVRRIFTDLVHLGDEEQHIPDSRRRRALATLIRSDAERTDISQIVQELVADRLLVTSQDQESKQERVEIIHDALLWEWGLLKQWMEEDRRFLLWHQELERRMHAWVETNTADPAQRDPYKLFGGADLIEAIEWLNTRASDLREDERAFIQASRERQKQEEQSQKRYTRRMVLVGLAGLGLTVSAVTASKLLFSANTPTPPPPSLPLPYTYRGHTSIVNSVAWSPDGERLASGSNDETMSLWLWLQG